MKQMLSLQLFMILALSCGRQSQTHSSANNADMASTVQIKQAIRPQGISEYDNVHSGIMDNAGNLWFATTWKGGVYCYDGKRFANFTIKDGLCSNDVSCIYQDKKGMLWFGTDQGACRYNGKTFTHFPVSPDNGAITTFNGNSTGAGSTSQQVTCILKDKMGNMWFGTNEGVYRYNGKAFTPFIQIEAITGQGDKPNNLITNMIEDGAGNVWLGSWSRGGAYRYDGKTFTQFTDKDGLTDDMVASVLEDKKGNIWIGTRDHGVCLFDGKTFTDVTKNEGLSGSCIYAMLEDRNGNMWFATESEGSGEDIAGGVWRYDGINFTHFTTKDGLVNNHVFCIVEDNGGNLWFGTRGGGLCRYDGKVFIDFSSHIYGE